MIPHVSRKVVVLISVDWDGHSLLPENIGAMAAFRAMPDFRHIPLTHFLSAGYFSLSEQASWRVIRPEIRRGMRLNIDECALHVHCYRSLLEGAGVLMLTVILHIDKSCRLFDDTLFVRSMSMVVCSSNFWKAAE